MNFLLRDESENPFLSFAPWLILLSVIKKKKKKGADPSFFCMDRTWDPIWHAMWVCCHMALIAILVLHFSAARLPLIKKLPFVRFDLNMTLWWDTMVGPQASNSPVALNLMITMHLNLDYIEIVLQDHDLYSNWWTRFVCTDIWQITGELLVTLQISRPTNSRRDKVGIRA